MIELKLFLDLAEIGHHLFTNGLSDYSFYQAYRKIDFLFDRFEEDEGVDVGKLGTIVDEITIKLIDMPKDLRECLAVTEGLPDDECFFDEDLPETPDRPQLVMDLFTILTDLLAVGVNGCNIHEARLKIDALFSVFKEQLQEVEDDGFESLSD